ncbi:MAG TPA: cupin domain-containing protein [Acidimicrobiales bacterium]|nr:cupin domain-containing protein [Acidimicrobiales bacterium]
MEEKVRTYRETSELTAQTPGMHRRVAIAPGEISRGLWFGTVICPPGLNSGPHHHGEAETTGFCLRGPGVRIYFGDNYEEFVDYHEGDFLYVPPWIPHIEVNLSDTEPSEFVFARQPDNIVVNLPDDEIPDHLRR